MLKLHPIFRLKYMEETFMSIPSEDDCKYVAGIYEGEGSVGAYLQGYGKYTLRRPQIELRIEMYDKDIIEWIATTFEGNLTPRKRASQVSFSEYKLIPFLKMILPYMKGTRRREQAALVFKLHEAKKQHLSRTDVHRRQLLADLAGEINSYNYGGGHRTRRDYTHLSKPLPALVEDIVQTTFEERVAEAQASA
jgi:hypothetical protein